MSNKMSNRILKCLYQAFEYSITHFLYRYKRSTH